MAGGNKGHGHLQGSCGVPWAQPHQRHGVLGSQRKGSRRQVLTVPHPNHCGNLLFYVFTSLAPMHPHCFHNSALLNLEFMPLEVVCKIIHVGEYENFSGARSLD